MAARNPIDVSDAAIALEHALLVATRDERNFRGAPVRH